MENHDFNVAIQQLRCVAEAAGFAANGRAAGSRVCHAA